MKNPFKFEPKPMSILIAIASAVAIAGATIYVGLIALWLSGQFPPTEIASANPVLTITSTTIITLLTMVTIAGLWRYSGQVAPDAAKSLRATYAAGVGIIFGWWLGLLLFGFTYL